MKKIFTLIAFLSFVALGARAQTDTLVYENFNVDNTALWPVFNSGNDTTWVDYDVDGAADGSTAGTRPGNWFWSDAGFTGDDTTGCLYSNSWLAPAGAPQNYLILPPVTLADASGVISWRSAPYQTPQYLDGYKVLVSTTDNLEASFTDTLWVGAEYISNPTGAAKDYSLYTFSPGFVHGADGLYTEPYTAATYDLGLLEPFSASLAAYAGQTIYIAFLHDSYDDNLLELDDVLVTQDATVGIAEPSKATTVRVYPNPVSDKIQLDYNLVAGSDVVVRIFDTKGSVVKEISKGSQSAGNQKMTINVSDLASGAYSISLIAGSTTTHSTVVINHN